MVEDRLIFEELYQNNEFKHLDLTLSRIENALNDISFNEKDLGQIVHIAGTNGKGSTAKFISDMLLSENLNVALYTSPHLVKINERIVYNGHSIKDDEFDELVTELKPVILKNSLSYFETLTLVAFKYFSLKKPQFSIIETGLGGRFDATNVLNYKLPVITSISYDHADILGNNIYKIADEKLAIVKNNKVVFVGHNQAFMRKFIGDRLGDSVVVFADKLLEPLSYPYPYCYNFSLAKAVFKHLTTKDYNNFFPILPPCRFERHGKIIFDGSHTVNGLLGILKNFSEKPDVIFSLTKERNLIKFLNILKKYAHNIYLTEIPNNDRSIKIHSIDIGGVNLIENPLKAIRCAIERSEEREILITGSLYLCAYLKRSMSY
jgi:dihydrofolate synthase/folylpolyglutamate synthase